MCWVGGGGKIPAPGRLPLTNGRSGGFTQGALFSLTQPCPEAVPQGPLPFLGALSTGGNALFSTAVLASAG